jgi:hypothetical protein
MARKIQGREVKVVLPYDDLKFFEAGVKSGDIESLSNGLRIAVRFFRMANGGRWKG